MLPLAPSFRSLTDRLLQELISLPSNLAFKLASQPWIERGWLWPRYQEACDRHVLTHPLTDPLDQSILTALQETGLYVTSLEALGLPGTLPFLAAAQQVSQELDAIAQQPSLCPKHTLTASAPQLMQHPEVILWGASTRLSRIIEHYLQLPVAYDGPSFYYSIANGLSAGPRCWHRDKEDWRMVKVAVYLNAVDSLGGPFQCVTPKVNQYLLKTLAPQYRALHHHQLEPLIPNPLRPWYQSCTGSAGTVVFCDTAQYYHRGCPPVEQNRSAIFFSYFSRSPKYPFFASDRPFLANNGVPWQAISSPSYGLA
ncbi:MAG: hypothetical protein HC857_02235 [Synechococcales cyanobacterium RU_4_20]|nr:hypothetical protein [Synechococcales cyanobacterium RU_4_20]